MSFEHWLAFVVASTILVVIPGPTILLVISYTLTHGRRASTATVAGVALGDFTSMTASMLGVGALLAASAAVFTALKWVGAAYLIYLGLKLWRAPIAVAEGEGGAGHLPDAKPVRILAHTWLVTALNPKGIVFFVAFLPQFLDPGRPILPQMLVFGVTFLTIATTNAALYGIAASRARDTIRKPAVQKLVNRTGGTFMIGAGLVSVGFGKVAA